MRNFILNAIYSSKFELWSLFQLSQRKPSKWINNAICSYQSHIDYGNGKKHEYDQTDEITIAVFKHGSIDIYINPVDDERYDDFKPFTMTLEELHMLPDLL